MAAFPSGDIFDANFYKTVDQVNAELGRNGELDDLTKIDDTIYFFHKQYFDVQRVVSIKKLGEEKVTYPISLPKNVEFAIIPKDTVIYRYARETEGPKTDGPRFYAESDTFDFESVASASGRGRMFTYIVQQDLTIVNFNKRWRSQLWCLNDCPADEWDCRGMLPYHLYEDMLYTICKNAGAKGWRAAIFNDQKPERKKNKMFLGENTEFEIALFSSDYVEKIPDAPQIPAIPLIMLRF